MPYIEQYKRASLTVLADGAAGRITTPGEANYFISRFLRTLLQRNRPSYNSFNSAIGILECCKLELYRRIVAPYEDKKMEENGDIV